MTPAEKLDACLDEHDPAIAKLARACLRKLRPRLKGAVEMVYDNYNALVVGFGGNERPSLAVLSLVIFPARVSLCFIHGKKLADPKELLRGEGNQVRFVRLESAATLDEPGIADLVARAIAAAPAPIDPTQRRKLIIKSVSAKRRPRRPRG